MVIAGYGARVKVYPLCFEFQRADQSATLPIEITIRLPPDAKAPAGGFRVEVDEASAELCAAAGFDIVDRQARATLVNGTDFEARINVRCSAPAVGQEQLARLALSISASADGGGGPPSERTVGASSESGTCHAVAPALTHADLCRSTNHVLPLWKVLVEEYEVLGVGGADWKAAIGKAVEGRGNTPDMDDLLLKDVIRITHEMGRAPAALCLSGGGIRSATFGLGVTQGLARLGLLGKLDYLSSVSGGGYVASWLSAWIHRADGIESIADDLTRVRPRVGAPEPPQIRHLREYSNYLSPRTGLFSADTWTLAAIFVRNLLLNQLVVIPILAAFLALPLLGVVRPPEGFRIDPRWLYWASVALGFVAFHQMNGMRFRERGQRESHFLIGGLLPLLGSAGLMVAAVGWTDRQFEWAGALEVCAVWSLLMPVTAYGLSAWRGGRRGKDLWFDVVAVALAGACVTAIYGALLVHVLPAIRQNRVLYVWVAPVLVLGPVLIGKTLFTAFVSLAEEFGRNSEKGDAEREWWARWSAWVLISLVGWLTGSAIALYGPWLLSTVTDWGYGRLVAYLTGGGLGAATSLLGRARGTPAKEGEPAKSTTWQTYALAFVAPLFCVVLAVLIADATRSLLEVVHCWSKESECASDLLATDLRFLDVVAVIAVLGAAGALMGLVVNVNRFSLQAMYRNRLVRAYLGASRLGSRRRPNRFTGFDPKDNLRLWLLRDNRPLPVINMALNLVGGAELAWQERKATSFTATPLHCGSAASRNLGYRRSPPYGGSRGISLATAVATSGAAANPSMGQSSSPAVSFIMTLFNARLGIWLGNPGAAGSKSFTRSGPRNSARPIFAEAFGHTDDRHPYVNLSDGGHFDNLGLYEMVRRRCRLIVVSDAGCDRAGELADLGSAIRKIRVDFGIPIEFDPPIDIASAAEPRHDGKRSAIALIRYDVVDGKGAQPGTLVYLKPTLCGREPYDIYNYWRSNPDFPHETTADQWFSESQFESYRSLGELTILEILGERPLEDFVAVEKRVRTYLGPSGGGAAVTPSAEAINGAEAPSIPIDAPTAPA